MQIRQSPVILTSLFFAMSAHASTTNSPIQHAASIDNASATEDISMPTVPVFDAATAAKIANTQLPSRRLSSQRPTRILTLPALQDDESKIALLQNRRQMLTEHNQPLQVGFARKIQQKHINLANLEWRVSQRGTLVTVFEIKSEFAAALRAAMQFESTPRHLAELNQARIRFFGNDGKVFDDTAKNFVNEQWSPVITGDVLTVELELPTTMDPRQFRLHITQISHLKTAPNAVLKRMLRSEPGSDRCERDVACKQNPSVSYTNTANAVARMLFTSNGNTFICTGTLLNNNNTPKRYLFWTAAHCIQTRKEAASLETYWFYQHATCNEANSDDSAISLNGGARLLYTNPQRDTTLLELNKAPPPGAFYAGWSNQPLTRLGTPVIGFHHPVGDVKKYSSGKVIETNVTVNNHRPYFAITWLEGVTEEGSSGSGLFTLSPTGDYQLRGGLYGGTSSCMAEGSPDYYSRFSDVFERIRPYFGK